MRKFFSVAAIAAAAMAGSVTSANAALLITIGNGVTSVSCDNSTAAGVTACGVSGFNTVLGGTSVSLLSSFNIGTFAISGTITTSNNPGNSVLGTLNQTTLAVNSTGAGFFYIDLLSQGFNAPAGPDLTLIGSASYSSSAGGAVGSVKARVMADPLNLGTIGTNEAACTYNTAVNFVNGVTGGCVSNTNWTRGAGQFSLRQIQEFTFSSAVANTDFTNNLTVRNRVPEPLTASLVGLGLLAAGFASRRARKAA